MERLVTATPGLLGQHEPGGQGQGIFLADVVAVLVHDRQSVGVGVLGEADGRLLPADFVGQAGQVFRRRLRLVRELAVGRGVDVDDLAAELAQQRRRRHAAGPVHAVEHHLESPGGDAQHVHVVQHPLDVQGVRLAVSRRRNDLLDRDELRARPSSKSCLRRIAAAGRRGDGRTRLRNFSPFHWIGLWLAVAIMPASAREVLDHHRHARRGDDVQVDHLDPERTG